ncbi:MAG: biotin/lipoyl-containing protein [Caldilineaceae bacterium]
MATNITVPALGESVVEATIARWLKQEGDAVKAGEAVVELETDKVDLEVPAEKDGVLSKIARQAGEDVQIGDVLGIIEEGAAAATNGAAKMDAAPQEPAPPRETPPALPTQESTPPPAKEERATPVAKRMAAEQGVDLEAVSGAGPGGRATRQDVENYVRTQQQPATPAPATAPRRTTGHSATRHRCPGETASG